MPRLFALVSLFTAGLLFHAPAVAQTIDVVRLKSDAGSGSTVRGQIKRMNKRNLIIESGGSDRRVDVDQIRLVTFANEPRELREARTDLLEGRENRAYAELQGIDPGNLTRDYLQQEVRFLKAATAAQLALRGEDVTLADARQQLESLLRSDDFAENYNYYAAVKLRGELALATGNFEEAEARFTELSELPWPETSLTAQLRVGECQLGRGAADAALASFETVLSSELNNEKAQDVKLLAEVGRASALAATGQADEGIARLQSLIKQQSSENKELFARLYNALGRCYLQIDQPKRAKHQFLHVDLLFNQDPETHAEALYFLVELWAQENKIQNSNAAREVLRSRYPNSLWTSKL